MKGTRAQAVAARPGHEWNTMFDDGTRQQEGELDERVLKAKVSEEAMESLLTDYKPFFAHTASKYALRSAPEQNDELFSVAQMSFYEAVKSFDAGKGHFFPFAKQVVRNSMIDHVRKAYRKAENTVPLEQELDVDGKPMSSLLGKVSIERHGKEERQRLIAEELGHFRKELANWKISMETLVKESPKHASLRATYRDVVVAVLGSPSVMSTIFDKHYLPVKEISKLTGLPQKKIERARTFILAAILIKKGDYEFLSDYVEGWGGF